MERNGTFVNWTELAQRLPVSILARDLIGRAHLKDLRVLVAGRNVGVAYPGHGFLSKVS